MRDPERTKASIDSEALRLFVENGVTETTIRDISTAAGIAEGTIYRHYQSKDDLAVALYSAGLKEVSSHLAEAVDPTSPLKQQLDRAIHIFCRLFDEEPLLFRYILLQQHAQLKRLTANHPHPLFMLRDALAKAISRREIPKSDPAVMAAMILGLVTQVAVSRLYDRHAYRLQDLAETISQAAWRVVAGSEAKK